MANTEIDPFAYNPAAAASIFGELPPQAAPKEVDISQYLPQAQPMQGRSSSYDEAFQQAESQYGLPSGLLSTIGFHESRFNPKAESPAGAKGLMQFMPATANEYGINARDPYASIDAAGKKMSGLVKYYNGDMAKAVAAYNYGEGNLNKAIRKAGDNWISAVPRETQFYVSKVLGGQPQGQEAQGPQEDTYPIPLASGRTLYAPKGMPREEALASARAQGVDAVGLRDISLASGKTLQVPEHLTDEEAIKQASEAHPDIDFTLAKKETPSRTVPQAVKDIGVGTMKGGVGLGQSLVGLVDILTPGQFGKSLEEHGINLEKAQQYLDTQYSPQQQEAINNLAQAHGFRNILQAAVENPTAVISMAGESLPQVIGGGVVGAGAKLAGLGRFAAAGLGQGSMTAGSTGETVRTATPERELTTKGQVAALGAGAVEAALGKYGSEFVTKIGGIDPNLLIMGEVKKLAVDTVGEVAENPKFFTTVLKSLVGEGVEEIPQEAQAQMFQNYATYKPLLEGVEDAATKGLITGAVTGAGAGTVGALSAQPTPEITPEVAPPEAGAVPPEAEVEEEEAPKFEITPEIAGYVAQAEAVKKGVKQAPVVEQVVAGAPAAEQVVAGAPAVEEVVPEPTVKTKKEKPVKIEPTWLTETLGLPESSAVYKRIASQGLDINNPEQHDAIDRALAPLSTNKKISGDQWSVLDQRMEAVKQGQPIPTPEIQNAQQIPSPSPIVRDGGTQPQEGQAVENIPQAGEGVEPSRQGEPIAQKGVEEKEVAPEVALPQGIKVPKVQVPEVKAPTEKPVKGLNAVQKRYKEHIVNGTLDEADDAVKDLNNTLRTSDPLLWDSLQKTHTQAKQAKKAVAKVVAETARVERVQKIAEREKLETPPATGLKAVVAKATKRTPEDIRVAVERKKALDAQITQELQGIQAAHPEDIIEPIVEVKKPEPIVEVKKPEPIVEVKKPEPIVEVKKPEPITQAVPVTSLDEQELNNSFKELSHKKATGIGKGVSDTFDLQDYLMKTATTTAGINDVHASNVKTALINHAAETKTVEELINKVAGGKDFNSLDESSKAKIRHLQSLETDAIKEVNDIEEKFGHHDWFKKIKEEVNKTASKSETAPKPKKAKPKAEVKPKEKAVVKSKVENAPEWAQYYATRSNGTVVHVSKGEKGKEIALIQGYNAFGSPKFFPAIEGARGTIDVESYKEDKFFSTDELKTLIEAKNKWLEADTVLHEANPNGPFKAGEDTAYSENVPENIKGVIEGWKKLMGIKERVYFTTVNDAKSAAFHGPYAAIPSHALNEMEGGNMRKLPNGDFIVAYRPSAKLTQTLEIISHEMGHILEKTSYANADAATRAAIKADFNKWLASTKGKTAREHVESLRARSTGKGTKGLEGYTSEELNRYWREEKEWFSDQVSRWATTTAKPVSIVEKFFSRLGKALKNFFLSNRQYLPTKNMHAWLDSLEGINISEGKEVKDTGELEQMKSTVGPSKAAKDLGKAIADENLVKTSDKKPLDSVKEGFETVKKHSTLTNLRKSWIDSSAGLSKALSSLPSMDTNGELRADLIHSKNQQLYNLVRTSFEKGYLVLAKDGGLMSTDDSELALNEIFKRIDDLGYADSRKTFFSAMRVLAGESNLKHDAEQRALAKKYKAYARKLEALAKTVSDKTEHAKITRHIAGLKSEASRILNRVGKKVGEGTEKRVNQEQIDLTKELLANDDRIEPIMADIYAALRKSVDLWEETGLITSDMADNWRSNPAYIPLYKSIDDLLEDPSKYVQVLKSGAKSLGEVKARLGGLHDVNVGENLVKHFAFMAGAAAQNQYRKIAAKQLTALGGAKLSGPDDPQAVMFREDGKKVYVHVDDPLAYEAFQTAIPVLGAFSKVAQHYTKVFRGATLINPVYWYRQLIRDPMMANLVSQTGFITPLHSIKAMAEILSGTSKSYETLKRHGVVGAVDSLTDPAQFVKAAATKRGAGRKAKDWIMHVHESSDAATRVAVYDKAMKDAKKKGMTGQHAEDYAAMRAREIINFSKRGNAQSLAAIRATVPFFSAQLNGMDTLARAAFPGKYGSLNKEEAAQARKHFYTNAAILTTISMSYALALQDDEEYIKSPDWVNSWLVPTGDKDKPFFKVPIPFEAGFFFKVIPELIVRLNSGTLSPAQAEKELKKAAVGLLAPSFPLPQILKPVAEVATNYDIHTGNTIENFSESRLPMEQRTAHASNLAKLLGEALPLSPDNIEHLGRGWFTEAWAMSAALSDAYLNKGVSAPEKTWGEMPMLKGVFTAPGKDRALSEYYDMSKTASQIHNAVMAANKMGDRDTVDAIKNDPDKLKQFKASPALQDIGTSISAMQHNIKRIKAMKDTEVSPAEKAKRIRVVQDRINNLAQKALVVGKRFDLDI